MPSQDDLQARVTDLEILLTHLQRDLADLNAVVLQQQRTIDTLKLELAQGTGAAPQPASDADSSRELPLGERPDGFASDIVDGAD